MTATASTSSGTNNFPFDFSPHATQDSDFLRQLEFVPGLKEILTIRQVHALEHATVWVLSDLENSGTTTDSNESIGGMSTRQGFYLYGSVNPARLQQAVETALQRITSGEWNLAVHPRCGTNLSVAMTLTAGLAMGINLLLPRKPIEQLLGFGVAVTAATQLAPELGSFAQKYITTAIPFNLRLINISATQDLWGRPTHFVQLSWIN
ncbi:MAG: DUF6391 domain-containing protein [Microcoleaceae cyanobacterium MO_207.B10]|nr:DUF6391 domain-containing protein [Microcoleaceae cyanobacterium MO_207.B10]